MKKRLLKIAIILSLFLLLLEIYRWYQWNIDFNRITVWEFLFDKRNTGLLLNLLLAWVAVGFALFYQNTQNRFLEKFFLILWLLWMPNTLYLVTDLKYFGVDETISLWHEILFFSLFVILGVLLYIISVYLVQLKLKFNEKWWILITLLAILGVILGRIYRWNSWDVLLNPQKILTFFLDLF